MYPVQCLGASGSNMDKYRYPQNQLFGTICSHRTQRTTPLFLIYTNKGGNKKRMQARGWQKPIQLDNHNLIYTLG